MAAKRILPRRRRSEWSYDSALFENTFAIGLIERLAQFGKVESSLGGGLHVPGFSSLEMDVFDEYESALQAIPGVGDDDIEVHEDAIGNRFFVMKGLDPTAKAIMLVTHLDTVPNGGKWDGRLMAILSAMVIRALKRMERQLNHNLIIVLLRCEEADECGNGTLGGQLFTGRRPATWVLDQTKRKGITVRDALALEETYQSRRNGRKKVLRNPEAAHHAFNRDLVAQIGAAIEVHIEQGQELVLGAKAPSCAISSALAGPERYEITLVGETGHTGSTPNAVRPGRKRSCSIDELTFNRRDALLAAMIMGRKMHEISAAHTADGSSHRATITSLETWPGGRTQIPGRVKMFVEIRDVDTNHKADFIDEVWTEWRRLAKKHEVEISFMQTAIGKPAETTKQHCDNLRALSESLGVKVADLPSYAWHDVGNLSLAGVPTSLLLVRSPNGSHNPNEVVHEADLHDAFKLLLGQILDLDWQLPLSE